MNFVAEVAKPKLYHWTGLTDASDDWIAYHIRLDALLTAAGCMTVSNRLSQLPLLIPIPEEPNLLLLSQWLLLLFNRCLRLDTKLRGINSIETCMIGSSRFTRKQRRMLRKRLTNGPSCIPLIRNS